MQKVDYRNQMDGYEDILKENLVLRKYGIDYLTQKGKKLEIKNRLHPTKLQLRIISIREINKNVKKIRFATDTNYLPPFQAGQYINIFVEIGGVKTSRPYSISSSPGCTGFYEITVKRVSNGFVSNYLLDEVKIGERLETTSPSGHFYYNPLFHGRNLVFIAGGSGITPFMSINHSFISRSLIG